MVFYERPDIEGPKLSKFTTVDLKDSKACEEMKIILNKTNGSIGVVEKTRKLYLAGESRIHIDQVKDLGDFVEIEVSIRFFCSYDTGHCLIWNENIDYDCFIFYLQVVLRDDQELWEGEEIAKDLMHKLEISDNDLVPTAYFDLLSRSIEKND